MMTKIKRQKQFKKASAILTADWHIREDTPSCRTDDFWAAQERKINFIFDLAKKNSCPIFIAGDLGHRPRWSCRLLEWFIKKIDKDLKIFITPGQHDILHHKLDSWNYSGIGVLYAAEVITLLGPHDLQSDWIFNDSQLNAFPYGEPIHHIKSLKGKESIIAMTHQMVIEDSELWPGQQAQTGHQLLKQFPEYNLILSGDNHNPFVAKYNGRILVNPGSMMRTTAAQIEHKPRVYLWYAKENKVTPVFLPIEQDVISRAHIEIAEERSTRMDAYTQRAREDVEIELSFQDNTKRYLETHRTQGRVKTKIWEAIG